MTLVVAKNRTIWHWTISAFILIACRAAFGIEPSQINWWTSVLGVSSKDPAIFYSLLSVGYFKPQISYDFSDVKNAWIAEHPKAIVRAVLTRERFNDRVPGSRFNFIWIVDGDEVLNVHLVRHGCVAAAQMFSLSDEDMQTSRNQLGMPKDKLQISQKEYDKVKNRLIAAENSAKSERLGIWSTAESNLDRTDD
jgi:hypothetical protein